MEYNKISKTQFRDSYNIVEILTSKDEIMEYAKTLKNDNNQAVAFAVRKRHNVNLEDRVSNLETKMASIDEKLDLIMQEIKGIKDRLDRNHIY